MATHSPTRTNPRRGCGRLDATSTGLGARSILDPIAHTRKPRHDMSSSSRHRQSHPRAAIILTASESTAAVTVERALACGADHFIPKPHQAATVRLLWQHVWRRYREPRRPPQGACAANRAPAAAPHPRNAHSRVAADAPEPADAPRHELAGTTPANPTPRSNVMSHSRRTSLPNRSWLCPGGIDTGRARRSDPVTGPGQSAGAPGPLASEEAPMPAVSRAALDNFISSSGGSDRHLGGSSTSGEQVVCKLQ